MKYLRYIIAITFIVLLAGCADPSRTVKSSGILRPKEESGPHRAFNSQIQKEIDDLLGIAKQYLDRGLIDQAENEALEALRKTGTGPGSEEINPSAIAQIHNLLGMIYLKRSLSFSTAGDIGKAKDYHSKGLQEFKKALKLDLNCLEAKENIQSFGNLEIRK